MLSLRVTAPDGNLRILPLHGHELTVGRAPDNALVLDGGGVSSHHCAFLVQGGRATVVDRGSTNGTFVNNAPVQQSSPLGEHDRIYVGQYLLQVVDGVAGSHLMTTAPTGGGLPRTPAPSDAGARMLIQREDRAWRDELGRLQRYSELWDQGRRADHLALRPDELRRAQKWLAQTPPERQDEITALQRELIEASVGANKRLAAKRALLVVGSVIAIGGLVTTAVMLWPEGGGDELVADGGTTGEAQAEEEPEPDEEPDEEPDPDEEPGEEPDEERVEIKGRSTTWSSPRSRSRTSRAATA
jgi:pSer/pThr/pTyr-binding forkhead associated (FHA) protein